VKDRFYRVLVAASRWAGLWVVSLFASIIAAFYFLFLPRRTGHSVRLYRALFPERGGWHAYGCAWRQYQDFARIYTERLEVERITTIGYESEGHEYIEQAVADKRGAILLMSHFGRWEIAARLLARDRHPMTLMMGAQQETNPNKRVAMDLKGDGVGVVAVSEGQGQPFDVLEAVDGIRNGGVVSLSGDRAWGNPRVLRLPFLGKEVAVPVAPFVLALVTGAPLLTVFACRTGPGRYRFTCSRPRYLKARARNERDAILRGAAQEYLAELESMMRAYPEQWQTFGPFLLEPGSQGATQGQ